MAEKTLAGQLKILTQDQIQTYHNPPQKCTLQATYPDDPNRADVQTEIGILKHIPKIGGSTIGNLGIVIFIDNDSNQPFAIIDSD